MAQVLKIDIEGEEHRLLPSLIARNLTRLVDVLLWECHHGVKLLNDTQSTPATSSVRDATRDAVRAQRRGRPSTCSALRRAVRPAFNLVYEEPQHCPSASQAYMSNWGCANWKA